MQFGKILLLLFIANGAPIILRKMLDERFGWAVDGGLILADGRPLFGPSKTWRGVAGALLASMPAAWLLGFSVETGLEVGTLAMLGDLFSSFLKRRLGFPPSGMALGIDQIPESLLPLLRLKAQLNLALSDVFLLTAAFLILELGISKVLYWLHIRNRPY